MGHVSCEAVVLAMFSRSAIVALVLLGVLACAGVVQGEEGGQVAAVGDPEWEKCVHIHDVGEACVEITVDEADLSLTIALVIANHTVLHETVSANQTLCVNLDTLLDLVGDVCIPCKPVIKLIEEFGHKITNEISTPASTSRTSSGAPTRSRAT